MSKKTILITEDDENLRKVLSTKLQKKGNEVLEVSTAQEALHQLQNEKVDLIILDIMLPGKMNGFDLLAIIRRSQDLLNIPVFVTTNLEGEEETAKMEGADEYYVKSNTSLGEIVENVEKRLND
ncbi:response regulator [Patescibacteria group bacterium]